MQRDRLIPTADLGSMHWKDLKLTLANVILRVQEDLTLETQTLDNGSGALLSIGSIAQTAAEPSRKGPQTRSGFLVVSMKLCGSSNEATSDTTHDTAMPYNLSSSKGILDLMSVWSSTESVQNIHRLT